MDLAFLDELKSYVGFTAEDASLLRGLRPILEKHAPAVADEFYAAIQRHPRASASVTGGEAQIARLKETLRRWMVELADDDYGASYLERRSAIGWRHVQIALPQVFMVTAMSVVRVRLRHAIAAELASDRARRDLALGALHKVLDIDLAIMLEAYQEATLEKVRRSERRAMIGELAARVNHELRTRLGTIKSSAFLLEKLLKDAPESVTKHVKRVQWGAERAGATVAALLNLARELRPQIVAVDLNHLVREAAASVAPRPGVVVELELARESPRIQGDPELLVSVVANLVQNAVEAHGDRGGRVIVRTAREGRSIVLRVLDEGVGLAPHVAPHIFEPFFTTKPDGTGLGLAIAHEIVQAHGGKIEARSRSDRGGAEFVVELRLEGETRT